MASSSSSSNMASTSTTISSYDVFLSFRGEDTRHSFTDHLYGALTREGILAFRDNEEIRRGEEISHEIEQAIKKSRASIVVLSENYATSTWCLDELLLILEQKRVCNHFVLPVFYHVNPSDVSKQNKTFTVEVKSCSRWTDQNVKLWKTALMKVGGLGGMVLDGSETIFISKVVAEINRKLNLKLVSTPSHLTGVDTRADEINTWLKDKKSITHVVAICGMGGSGKTTLARYIYNSNKQNFESSCFLEDIGKHGEQPHSWPGLQKQLLTDILGGRIETISSVPEGTSKIMRAIEIKSVLLVLDDIDDPELLSALLGTPVFCEHSKIIVTTRFLNICEWSTFTACQCWVVELKLLNSDESLKLLSSHAFESKNLMEGFEDLAKGLAHYCAGNPLALKVLGSSLFVSAGNPRKVSDIIETWRSTLNSLNSLKGDLDRKIQGILQKSFDSLPRASHKELFLHIALFFVGEHEDYAVKIMEQDWHAKNGINTLINRCLIAISPGKKLIVHNLLQEMARTLVSEESKNPGNRSRVVQNYEAYSLLRNEGGSKTIEGLALDWQRLKQETKSKIFTLRTDSFVKMDKLKLLRLNDVELTGSYNNFPELRWLFWHGCHFKKLPSGLLMSSLVAIDMSYRNMETFEIPVDLDTLKILNLKGSRKLVSICNLFRLPNLETLILWKCSSLTHICKSISNLKSLALLDLTECKNLWQLSWNMWKAFCVHGETTRQQLFSLPHSLKFLFLNYCSLEDNDDVHVDLVGQPLYVNLGNNMFKSLPNTIDLKMLRVLDLTCCPDLKSLLYLPRTLEELYTHQCASLEKVTFQSARFRLRAFGYEGCLQLSEIQGLFKLISIKELKDADLGHMKWIKRLEKHVVVLVGDEITKGRIWLTQMLYEYGIRSTYLTGIEDQRMASEYMSSSSSLSFHVPSCSEKLKIQGLNVTCIYRSSVEVKDMFEDEDMWVLFVKINNTTKSLTWVYNPVVFGKPKPGEDILWLSYWPIGNILDTGDQINVSVFVENGLTVSHCGASIVYMDDGAQQGNCENYTEEEQVIGGDLSEFELSTGVYYLCRRDFFKSRIPDGFMMLLGDTFDYTELHRWRKSRQSQEYGLFKELSTFRGIHCGVTQVIPFKA